MTAPPLDHSCSPWPHRLAVLLCCATFPLLWVGGLVTTYDAGMAVPDWPNTYGYNLFLYPLETWVGGPFDLFVEHGHRLLGAAVGVLAIGFCVTTLATRCPAWWRWAAAGALLLVIVQGLMGGLRVLFDARALAQFHGCFGPLFFGACVALAAVTSTGWRSWPVQEAKGAGGLRRLALFTAVLAYVQIVLGSELRHVRTDAGPRWFQTFVLFHLLVAAALVVHVALLSARVWRGGFRSSKLTRPVTLVAVLLFAQLCLGGATWVTNYGWPDWFKDFFPAASYVVQAKGWMQANLTTAHMALGSLIWGLALLVALRAGRLYQPRATHSVQPTRALGAAA